MNSKILTLIILLLNNFSNAQTGIVTTNANSTLTADGSFQTKYREVDTNTIISQDDHYITYIGNNDASFTLPEIKTGDLSFAGRIYRIKNLSEQELTLYPQNGNLLRLKNTPITEFMIESGGYVEVVNNTNISGGTWDLSFIGNPIARQDLEFYANILKIPPHDQGTPDFTNNSNKNYDTHGENNDSWIVISKESIYPAVNHGPKMKIVYEYQGTPFNLTNLSPMITTGVNGTNPDVFAVSVMSIENNGTNGKTRFTIAVSRTDLLQTNTWWAFFNLYILFVRTIN